MTRRCPGLLGKTLFGLWQNDRLHHLAEHAVGKHHDRRAVLVGQIEGAVNAVGHLLHCRGRKHGHEEVAVPRRACGLPIVGLRWLDAAEARAPSLHVDDDARQIRAGHVRDALAFKRDSGARRGRHRASAGGRGAVHHVDCRDFAFSLQIRPADLRHTLGHVGRKLGLRRDGITEEETAPGAQRAFRKRLVSLHKNLFSHNSPPNRDGQTSGHITAHEQHPTHFDWSMQCAG